MGFSFYDLILYRKGYFVKALRKFIAKLNVAALTLLLALAMLSLSLGFGVAVGYIGGWLLDFVTINFFGWDK